MDKLYLIIFFEIIAIIIIEIIICYIIKLQYSLQNENRLANYSINSDTKYSLPLFAIIRKKIINIIKWTSKILSKGELLKKYSKRYSKYIEYKDKNKVKSIDYVSFKLLFAIFICFLYLITSTIRLKIDFMILLIIFIISFFIPDLFLIINHKQKRDQLENDLLEAVIIMNNSFKSGKNILEAIEIVKEEIKEPLKDEFRKIYIDLTHGLDIDVVFKRFYERIKIDDIKYMTSSLTLLNKSGGNIVKVFSSIETNFYDKKVLTEELESLTSASKLMYRMLLIIPFVIISLIIILNPTYFSPLVTTIPGAIIIILALILYVTYALIIKKIMKVKL